MPRPYNHFVGIDRRTSALGAAPHGLDPEHAPEPAVGIVRGRAVVIDENMVVAAIGKERTAEFADRRRGLHPTRCLRIELA